MKTLIACVAVTLTACALCGCESSGPSIGTTAGRAPITGTYVNGRPARGNPMAQKAKRTGDSRRQ